MIETSKTLDQLLPALSSFQSKVPTIEKNKKANIPTKSGRSIQYTYADLTAIWEAIRPLLTDNGLTVSQMLDTEDGASYLVTILGHVSGQWMHSKVLLRCDGTRMTEVGGTITYMRRYALTSLLGIVSDDDVDAMVELENKQGAPKLTAGQVTELENILGGFPDIRAKFLKAYNLNSVGDILQKDYAERRKQIMQKIESLD